MRGHEERKPPMERFMRHISPEPNTGCWLWTGCVNSDTHGGIYGQLSIGGRSERVHRISYRLFKGEIPSGRIVRHKCDVTLCANPDHLLLGTHKDNSDDKISRGRLVNPLGEAHGCAKLTEAQILAIRAATAAGASQRRLAAQYGVSTFAIYYAVKKGWRHLAAAQEDGR